VNSLIRPADLEQVDVGWGPRVSLWGPGPGVAPEVPGRTARLGAEAARTGPGASYLEADEELWVLVVASGSSRHSQIWDIVSAEQVETLADAAYALADRLEDWVCECVYWGERPSARFEIPSR